MNRFRNYRWASRLSMLAIAALLWSQFMLASHPAATLASLAAVNDVATEAHSSCQQPPSDLDTALCSAHCAQGEQSHEVSRLPPISPLACSFAMRWPLMLSPLDHIARAELPPAIPWHRPTHHPASLLLI